MTAEPEGLKRWKARRRQYALQAEPEPECPLHPDAEPARPVRFAYCSGCHRVVKTGELCPLTRRPPAAEMDVWRSK